MKFSQIERIAAYECLRQAIDGYSANAATFIENDVELFKHRYYVSLTELAFMNWRPDAIGEAKIKLTLSQVIDLFLCVQAFGNMNKTEQVREFSRSLSYKLFTKIINNENN